MKILLVHNAYQQRGGEDAVVEAETALLRKHGHEVETYFRSNDEVANLSGLALAGQTLWSRKTPTDLKPLLLHFKPDILHVHNTFPLISPSLYWSAASANVPVVQTLHNFRLMCLNALFLREQRVCEDCVGHVPWRGITHACYRKSPAASAVLAGALVLHRSIGTWQHKIARYIALNRFCRDKFIEGGLPAERIAIKPNFVDFDAPPMGERSGFLFVGRLSEEKGIDVLAKAADVGCGWQLRVAGTGPLAGSLSSHAGVTALGPLNGEQVRQEMASAIALILPSIWYENFPRTLVESFGCGLPVIASRIGALGELVTDGVTGLLFDPGSSTDLAEKMNWAWHHPDQMAKMGRNARSQYEAEFTGERNHDQLINVYHEAIETVQQERKS